jgi:hypothetical protein
MGLLYAWATPDYILDQMSLEMLILYYNKGWESRKTESRIHWGTFGQLINEDTEEQEKQRRKEFRESHPDATEENGTLHLSA